ncbi:MAG: HAMP domain-containing histidine kinase [Chromatiales bacterium]|nr:HAMP domain-containing histidine kinase [Chromatiales bacterium]
MQDGLHRLVVDGRGWFVEVRQAGDLRFALMFDDAGIRAREDQLRRFLLMAGAVTVLLAGAIGWWLAGRIIAPVRDLADRVGDLDPNQRMVPLPGATRDDEIALLQDAFLAYQDRLADFVSREQAFTADASHELRTPVAVILGAVDVLRANPDLTPAQARAIDRIGRAGADMQNLIDSLLRLARENWIAPSAGPPVASIRSLPGRWNVWNICGPISRCALPCAPRRSRSMPIAVCWRSSSRTSCAMP